MFSQAQVDGSPIEAIDLQPAQQLHDVFVVVVDECLGPDDQPSFDQLHELIGDADDRVALAQLQKSPRPTTVFWWHRAPPANAHRVASPWIERQYAFDAHVMLPAIGEVVLIQEAFTGAEAEVGQAYVSGIVIEAIPPS